MLGVGIIGAGDYGKQHARALADILNVKLVAASRRNANALDEFVSVFGGTGYTDYHDLLADDAIDIVIIATPHHFHTDIAVAAAQAGKHILLEKPLAPTPQECELIVSAVQAADVQFMVGHVNHFVPAYQVARQMLQAGEMGEIVLGLATMQKYWMVDNRRNWHLDRATGGGVWMTVGLHPLDRLTWLIDNPVTSVSAHLATNFHDQNADDTGMVFLRYANDVASTIVSTGYKVGAPKHLTELTCTKGMMKIDYTSGVAIGKNETWQTVPESIANEDWMHTALVEEWQQFVQSIEDGIQPPVTANFAMHIMDVIFAAEQSSQEKREIPISSTLGV